jgi:hypothetical protein
VKPAQSTSHLYTPGGAGSVPDGYRLLNSLSSQIKTERRGRVVNTPASIREVHGPNLGPEVGNPEIFRSFPQSLQVNARIVP